MMFFIRDKVYTENNMLSAIIGQHGKEPWDFEITIPANYENRYIENCLYEEVIIPDAEDREIFSVLFGMALYSPKKYFVITKIEQKVDDSGRIYVISGIGREEYILRTSIATHSLSYNPGEQGRDMVVRTLKTFTGETWGAVWGGATSLDPFLNFKPIEKGQYLSEWFWDNFKKEKLVCAFSTSTSREKHAMLLIGSKGEQSKIINRFVSKTRVWENSFDMFYALANDFLFKYKKSPTSSNPMPQVLKGTYPTTSTVGVSTFRVSSLESALDRILRLEDASGNDLGLKVEAIVLDLRVGISQRFYVFVQTKTITHTPGVRIRIKQESPELITRISDLHLYRYPDTDLGTGVIVDNAVWYSEWKSNSHEGPVIPSSGTTMYGIRISNEIGDLHRYADTGEWFPDSFSFDIYQNIADIAAAGNIEYPELPDGHPRTDYEIFEEEFARIRVGDEIVILGEDGAILTDKVISYEDGEVHYDCTTSDLTKVDAKQ